MATGWKIRVELPITISNGINVLFVKKVGKTGRFEGTTEEDLGKIYKAKKTAEKMLVELNRSGKLKAELIEVREKPHLYLVKWTALKTVGRGPTPHVRHVAGVQAGTAYTHARRLQEGAPIKPAQRTGPMDRAWRGKYVADGNRAKVRVSLIPVLIKRNELFGSDSFAVKPA